MSNNVNVSVYGIYKGRVLYAPPNIATVGEFRVSLVQFGNEKTAQDKIAIYRNKLSGVDGILRGVINGHLQDLLIIDDYTIFTYNAVYNRLDCIIAFYFI